MPARNNPLPATLKFALLERIPIDAIGLDALSLCCAAFPYRSGEDTWSGKAEASFDDGALL